MIAKYSSRRFRPVFMVGIQNYLNYTAFKFENCNAYLELIILMSALKKITSGI